MILFVLSADMSIFCNISTFIFKYLEVLTENENLFIVCKYLIYDEVFGASSFL